MAALREMRYGYEEKLVDGSIDRFGDAIAGRNLWNEGGRSAWGEGGQRGGKEREDKMISDNHRQRRIALSTVVEIMVMADGAHSARAKVVAA